MGSVTSAPSDRSRPCSGHSRAICWRSPWPQREIGRTTRSAPPATGRGRPGGVRYGLGPQRSRAAGKSAALRFLTALDRHLGAGARVVQARYGIRPAPGATLVEMRAAARGAGVVGDLVLDCAAHVARRAGAALTLTATEFQLLATFVTNAGIVLSKRRLLEQV